MSDDLPYDAVLARIAELAESLTSPQARPSSDEVGELLDWIDAFHRDGLGRLVEMIRAWRGEIFLESVSADPLAGLLLAAYDLGEAVDPSATVEAALAEVRPMIESHGGALAVDSIVDGVVRVNLLGTCDGCPSSAATLTYGVEEALRRHWAGFRRLEVSEAATDLDPAKADLVCGFPPPSAPPAPEAPLLQIRGLGPR